MEIKDDIYCDTISKEEMDKLFVDIGYFKNNKNDIYIPLPLLRNRLLSVEEKFYLASYYIWDKNIQKADELSKLNKNRLNKIKKHLCKIGYISNINEKKAKELTIKLSHVGEKCEWCGKECYTLQKHHYPIQAKDGGKNVVSICPNCHYTFHSIMEGFYE